MVSIMAMAKLSIHQVQGAVKIETQAAQLKVVQSGKMRMSMRHVPAQMNVERRQAQIRIDQTESFASAGLETSLALSASFYRNSLSAGLSAIASIAEEGLRFLRIERGGHPIREIAMERGVRTRQVTLRPVQKPSIDVDPGYVNITWTPHSLETDWEWVEGQVDFVPHQISITMDPYPSIEIALEEGSEFLIPEPSPVGRHVDEKS